MIQKPRIGVIGGMGPYAGLDLVRKIFDETRASRDQEHVPVALLSFPDSIPDRSEHLRRGGQSPVPALVESAKQLQNLGATVIGIPCNTAHAAAIFDELTDRLSAVDTPPRILHIVQETVDFVAAEMSGITNVGVLSTLATFRLRLYADAIDGAGLNAVLPDESVQDELIDRNIFQPPH